MQIPNSYLVVDTETSGFKDPFVIQFGFCHVLDGKIRQRDSIDVIPLPGVEISEGATEVHGLTRQGLLKTGTDPHEILPAVREILVKVHDEGGWLLGQNFMGFDARTINNTFTRVGLKELDFDTFNVMDVGVVYKAYQLLTAWGWGDDAKRGERSVADYLKSIRHAQVKRASAKGGAGGLKWSLDTCVKDLGIDRPKRGAHDAGEDCEITHIVYQEMLRRGIVEKMFNG